MVEVGARLTATCSGLHDLCLGPTRGPDRVGLRGDRRNSSPPVATASTRNNSRRSCSTPRPRLSGRITAIDEALVAEIRGLPSVFDLTIKPPTR